MLGCCWSCVQGSFSAADSAKRGPNEAVWASLKELTRFEEALGGVKGVADNGGEPHDVLS
eukprot:gene3677-3938_t